MHESALVSDNNRERRLWSVECGLSPVIGTAVHDGHAVRGDILGNMALPDAARLREEDPFTSQMISGLVNRITVHRSRFEIDLNRSRDSAVYREPAQAWGLNLWRELPSEYDLQKSYEFHDDYYEMLEQVLQRLERRYGSFVVLDIHSYNHRRDGIDEPASPQERAPDINIGTFSMDRERWADVVDTAIRHFKTSMIGGRYLDVQENVAFQGKGEQTRFIHERFPDSGCAIAIEFKKIFMDEWTGKPDLEVISDISKAVTSLQPVLEDVLRRRS